MKTKMQDQLSEHFMNWIKQQREEIEEYESNNDSNSYLKEYYDGKSEKLKKINLSESFTIDGIVNEEEWDGNNGILFILKEANIDGKLKGNIIDNKSVCADINEDGAKTFWFQEEVNKSKINWRRNILRRLRKIGEDLTGEKEFSLKKTAYMNINKRGGEASANVDIIGGYLKKYKENILKEIEIINPKIIAICCGTDSYVSELVSYIHELNKDISIRCYNHPAAWRKGFTDKKYLEGINS